MQYVSLVLSWPLALSVTAGLFISYFLSHTHTYPQPLTTLQLPAMHDKTHDAALQNK